MTKGEALLEAVRKTPVGNNVILHNNDGSIWCILNVVAKEHTKDDNEDAEIWRKK